jgi:hypothetical protein
MVERASKMGVAQTRFDLPQTFLIGQLSEGHAEEFVPARKAFEIVVAVVLLNAFLKFIDRQEVYRLARIVFAEFTNHLLLR